MTNQYLRSLIDKLNRNKTGGLIHLRQLSQSVDFGKVWTEKPKPTNSILSPDGPYSFYFIKNDEGVYVAAVLDMTRDLHWYVVNKYRGNGYLTNALKTTILFHLFQNREEQRISINENEIGTENFLASQKVALSLGFITSEQNEYILTNEKYREADYIDGLNTRFTDERIDELKKQVNFLARSLWLIHTEMEMKLGDTEYMDDLKDLVDKIKREIWEIEDVCRESQNTSR